MHPLTGLPSQNSIWRARHIALTLPRCGASRYPPVFNANIVAELGWRFLEQLQRWDGAESSEQFILLIPGATLVSNHHPFLRIMISHSVENITCHIMETALFSIVNFQENPKNTTWEAEGSLADSRARKHVIPEPWSRILGWSYGDPCSWYSEARWGSNSHSIKVPSASPAIFLSLSGLSGVRAG